MKPGSAEGEMNPGHPKDRWDRVKNRAMEQILTHLGVLSVTFKDIMY